MAEWRGSRRARKALAPLVAAGVPCSRCGRPILPGQQWDADHLLPRALGGSDDPSNLWPAHSRCNSAEGGRRGSRITNRRALEAKEIGQPVLPLETRPATDPRTTERTRGIRGVN